MKKIRHFLRSVPALFTAGVLLGSGALLLQSNAWGYGAEPAVAIPAPAMDETVAGSHSETAVFAGGCFWGIQGVFQHVKGVTSALSGYTGGSEKTAQYETVSGGDTGHAESVKVTYDPTQVTYGQLLQIFFSVGHNPTELNFQGPDSGTQYRSAIFPQNEQQQKVAKAYIAQLNASHRFSEPVVTTVESGRAFYPAESYHQNYLTNNPDAPYIAVNDMPKLTQLKQMYPTAWRDKPVLVTQ
ncbi:peptide-methionine (S)-S-oxide reductase MsrA [Erwinia sp.]|uniref:peptide-methionine (S)-S-oxide reductase MsrA n=1 Tax=Erwinia citreus TaxID=558 RepID=UPI003C76945D